MKGTRIFFIVFGLGLMLLVISAFVSKERAPTPIDEQMQEISEESQGEQVVIVASELDTPWEITFLPNGQMLVALRSGAIRIIDGDTQNEFVVPDVVERGEGGLLGLALHPRFVENRFIFVYFTMVKNRQTINRVVRYVFDGASISSPHIILDDIPGGSNHNGGRIAFGPDNLLYITTGDAGREHLAQDIISLAGKILRVRDDGSIPEGNPFGTAVYSYGHRNSQGLAWDDKGRLWATEHGRSGILSGYDEINLIEAGLNYGWPLVQGSETRDGMRAPIRHSGATTTWAPAGMAYLDGALYFAGLRGRALYRVSVSEEGVLGDVEELFTDEFGRLRAVVLGPDGYLYVSTSNRDGRGRVRAGDDTILKINMRVE